MSKRATARKLALDILFEHEVGRKPVDELLERHSGESAAEFAGLLVRGVTDHQDELDQVIAEHARGWDIDRMPVVDRCLLRMGLFEILHLEDVPSAVAINEAVELAKTYSTEDSGRFINGVLGAIASRS